MGVKCSRVTNPNSTTFNFWHGSHTLCWFIHRRRTSSPEDIKRKEGGKNKIFYLHPKHSCNELMVAHIWNCWHCQLSWEWISYFYLPFNTPRISLNWESMSISWELICCTTQLESCSRFHSSICALKLSVKFSCLRRKVLFSAGRARRQSASHQTLFNPTTCLLFSEALFFLLVQGIERTKQSAPS